MTTKNRKYTNKRKARYHCDLTHEEVDSLLAAAYRKAKVRRTRLLHRRSYNQDTNLRNELACIALYEGQS